MSSTSVGSRAADSVQAPNPLKQPDAKNPTIKSNPSSMNPAYAARKAPRPLTPSVANQPGSRAIAFGVFGYVLAIGALALLPETAGREIA